MDCYDAHQLRLLGRSISSPFQLRLPLSGEAQVLNCRYIFRNLPGKRLVFGAVWDRRQVVAKLYLHPSAGKRHFQRELKGVQVMSAARIPTPALIYQGHLEDSVTPLLLFASIEKAITLDRHLDILNKDADRFTVLKQAVTTIARMHDAGLRQRDIHPGNFLWSDNGIWVIDGDSIEQTMWPLSPKAALSNLALFLAQFTPHYDPLVAQLTRIYIEERTRPMPPWSDTAIEDSILKWRVWRQRKFLRKIRRSCSAVKVSRRWRRFEAHDRKWDPSEIRSLLNAPDAWIQAGTILKAGNTATVARTIIDAEVVVVKRYNLKDPYHALRRSLRPSRAVQSWKNAHRLQLLGIQTPRPLALIEERWGLVRRRAYFIMEYIPGETINQALRSRIHDKQAINEVLNQLEKLLKLLAATRISHGDFKATNFIWSSGTLHLLDLDGMQVHRHNSGFKRAFKKDLLRLEQNWKNYPELHRPIVALTRRLMDALNSNGRMVF